jgi:hypothetical protein
LIATPQRKPSATFVHPLEILHITGDRLGVHDRDRFCDGDDAARRGDRTVLDLGPALMIVMLQLLPETRGHAIARLEAEAPGATAHTPRTAVERS